MQAVAPSPVPLVQGADGIFRLSGSRVTLDVVVAAFDAGATAEEIAQQYPSAMLSDVYLVLAYVLQRRSDVEAYLERRGRDASAVRDENERRVSPAGIRTRLLARRRGA